MLTKNKGRHGLVEDVDGSSLPANSQRSLWVGSHLALKSAFKKFTILVSASCRALTPRSKLCTYECILLRCPAWQLLCSLLCHGGLSMINKENIKKIIDMIKVASKVNTVARTTVQGKEQENKNRKNRTCAKRVII